MIIMRKDARATSAPERLKLCYANAEDQIRNLHKQNLRRCNYTTIFLKSTYFLSVKNQAIHYCLFQDSIRTFQYEIFVLISIILLYNYSKSLSIYKYKSSFLKLKSRQIYTTKLRSSQSILKLKGSLRQYNNQTLTKCWGLLLTCEQIWWSFDMEVAGLGE